jgi:RNAse (barnase) inhibitor barstar
VASFLFFDEPLKYSQSDAYIAVMSIHVHGKKCLLKDFYEKLRFPEYFGFNWDALYDCLCDLSWLNEKKIVLLYESLPSLDDESLHSFLDVVNASIIDWKEDDVHSLEVVFPLSLKNKIEEILN